MSDRRRLMGRKRAIALEAAPADVFISAPISAVLSLPIFIKSGPEPILPRAAFRHPNHDGRIEQP